MSWLTFWFDDEVEVDLAEEAAVGGHADDLGGVEVWSSCSVV
jgi:hypothetical protein